MKVDKYSYRANKFNKCDTQYELTHNLPSGAILTDRVKIEAFQGFSNAYNLGEYFRLRGATNWKDGKQLTGIWKTSTPNIFYGDRRTNKGKSLLMFVFGVNRESLTVYVYPDGYYPHKTQIETIAGGLRS